MTCSIHVPLLWITVATCTLKFVRTRSHISSGILRISWWMFALKASIVYGLLLSTLPHLDSPKGNSLQGKIRGVWRSWIVCATRDKPISREIPFEEFQWNIWARWSCAIMLINDSIHVDPLLSPQRWDMLVIVELARI